MSDQSSYQPLFGDDVYDESGQDGERNAESDYHSDDDMDDGGGDDSSEQHLKVGLGKIMEEVDGDQP